MAIEFNLPVVIIQQIQHYMDGKQAAQTVILSKSWHAAWLTRPTLYFNESCFLPKPTGNQNAALHQNFTGIAKNTVQRYKDAKLYVHKLVLIMNNDSIKNNNYCTILCDELIMDALKMGAYEFVIALDQKVFSSIRYVLPAQLLASTSLTKLDVSGCQIDKCKVLFSGITHLSLTHVCITSDVLRDLLLACPLIENLSLMSCDAGLLLRTVNVSRMRNIVELNVSGYGINVEFEDSELGLDVAESFFHLRILRLEKVKLKAGFLNGFSSRFPRVEVLLLMFVSCEDLEISSRSLRYLSVLQDKERINMRFDVPNIVRFLFKGGYDIPIVSFGSTLSRNWVSDVQFAFAHDVIDDSWFMDLRKFLTDLSRSRISLHIKLCGKCHVSVERLPRFPIPWVENLSLDASPVSHTSPSTWRCLMWSCRPRFITEGKPSAWWEKGHDPFILTDLYNLLRRDGDDGDLFYRMYNLKEVNLEHFDEELVAWQTIPLERLVDILEKDGDEQIRFRFNWG